MKFLFILISIILSQLVYSQEIRVLFSKGKNYKLLDSGITTSIKKGMSLLEKDIIATGKNGLIILKIAGHSTIRVEGSTKIRISQLPYFFENTDEIEREGSVFLEFGSLIIDMSRSFDSEALKIKTTNSSMGVRGTRFLVNRDVDNILLSVNKGQVEIHNQLSGEKDFADIMLEEGDIVYVQSKKRKTEFSWWTLRDFILTISTAVSLYYLIESR